MTEIQNIKPVWVIEKLRFEIYLACDELSRVEFGAWDLEFYILLFGIQSTLFLKKKIDKVNPCFVNYLWDATIAPGELPTLRKNYIYPVGYRICLILEVISKIEFWFKIAAGPNFKPEAYCCMSRI
jgi:hypothetical protein